MNKFTNAILSLPFILLGAIGVYAALPVSTPAASIEAELPRIATVTIGPVEQVFAAPVVKAIVAHAKPRKRVCDKRGHTVSVGMAKMVQMVNKSDTGVTVCWTE